MNSNKKADNSIRLKNKTARYSGANAYPAETISLYYPRTVGSALMLPFLLIASLLFLLINVSLLNMASELTWEMVFSVKMVLFTLFWLVMILLPTCVLLYLTYASVFNMFSASEPILVLTPDGLYHRSVTQSKRHFVAWSAIETIWVRRRFPATQNHILYFCMGLDALNEVPAAVIWVEFDHVKSESYTLYQNVLRYWRQYRGEHWQGNPDMPETGWIS